MNWYLFTATLLGWVIGFYILDKIVNWLEFRMIWWIHVIRENSYLKMNESAEQRFYWEDKEND